jgi:hypothetical protein
MASFLVTPSWGPPARAERAYVPRPRHIPTASRRCGPHGGREWRWRDCSRHTQRRPHTPPSEIRYGERPRHSRSSGRREFSAAPATHVPGRRYRGHRKEGPGRSRCLDEADNPRDESLIVPIGADEMRLREPILEIADELVRVVPQQDRRDALLAGGDLLVRTSRMVLRRGHAEHVRGLLVEASAGIEARVVDRLGDRVAGGQALTHLPRAVGAP